MIKHLLSASQLSKEDIMAVLDTARALASLTRVGVRKLPTLRGKTLALLFYEPSTRTRFSFELAAKRLSADVVSFQASGSSVAKGESLKDTARTIQAMGVDAIVLRHPSVGAPWLLASCVEASVINAGDGTHEHPTQALLDLYTMRERFGRLEGLEVAIVGDVLRSRVARSLALALKTVGANPTFVGPPTLLPARPEALGAGVSFSLDEVLPRADVVYLLRIQRERMGGAYLPGELEYSRFWGLGPEHLEMMRPEAVVMHPGPMNRGVEISWEVAESPRSLVEAEVAAGVAVRMALLYLMLGGEALHR